VFDSALADERLHVRPVSEGEGERQTEGRSPPQVVSGANVEMDGTVLCHDLTAALEDANFNIEIGWRLRGERETETERERGRQREREREADRQRSQETDRESE
jgi:hypothetical protein